MNRHFILVVCCVIFCFEGIGQNIEVSLTVNPYSPFITKYSKEQMKKELLDTVISTCHSQFLSLGRDITFYAKGDAKPRSGMPSYKLELKVTDTTFNTQNQDMQGVMVYSKFYEEEISGADLKAQGIGMLYNNLGTGRGTEADAIDAYFSWTLAHTKTTLQCAFPLSLTEKISARNIYAKDELDRLESFKEIIVKINSEGIAASKGEDINKMIAMVNNIFFICQSHLFSKKSKDGGRSQFNYYISDPHNILHQTVYHNPIEVKFVLGEVGNGDYQIKMEFDEKKYPFRDKEGVSKTTLFVPSAVLKTMPSRINKELFNTIGTFLHSNVN